MNDEMNEILGDFLAESSEMLEGLDQKFVDLESDPNNADLLNDIFRCMHSMKGSAGFLGFTHLVEVAHHGESLLNKLRSGDMTATRPVIDIILETVDVIKLLQEDIRKTGQDSHVETDLIVNKLALTIESAAHVGSSGPASGTANSGSPPQPAGQPSDSSAEPAEQPQSASTPSIPSGSPVAAPAEGLSQEKTEKAPEADRPAPGLSEMLSKMKEATNRTMEAASQAQSGRKTAREEDQSVRVETRRLDNVMNLVGELVLGRNRIMKLGTILDEKFEGDPCVRELGVTLANLNLVTSDLQLAVMKTRMVPIRKVFAKFPRLVRDLSNKLGKQIRLEMSGEDTEVDKSVADELGDPLVHLVRNSIDHAIETDEERKAAGKNLEGTVRL